MIAIGEEPWKRALPEIMTLHVAHHAELADEADRRRMPLDMDWPAYQALDDQGKLLLITAREPASNGHGAVLVGYVIAFVMTHMHYRGILCCFEDLYWLAPAYREPGQDSLSQIGSTGAQMFLELEAAARKRGVKKIFADTKLWQDNTPLFEMIGYKEVARQHTRWLGA